MTVLRHTLGRMNDALNSSGAAIASALSTEPHHLIVLRITLVLAVLHAANTPFAAVAVRTAGLLMLVLPPVVLQSAAVWWLMALIVAATNLDNWEIIDNHKFLITYWLAACAISLRSPDDLRFNARLLVAIPFAFAVAWKIVAGEYLDGGFFYFSLLTDGRLQNVAGLFAEGGIDGVRQLAGAVSQLAAYGEHGASLSIGYDPTLGVAAVVMCWSGLLIEGAVAVFHLLPGRRWYLARHVSLVTFIGFTYLLLPVVGFGFLLGTMGLAQVKEGDRFLQRAYIALLCFLQVTLVPWRNLL